MINDLKFVLGGVSEKGILPAFSHFKIENHTIRSCNGTIGKCSPIAIPINCTPKAKEFFYAVSNCDELITFTLADNRLVITSGAYTAVVPIILDETPHFLPEGEEFDVDGAGLYSAFSILKDLIGNDASRPWSNGVLLRGKSAYATNNVVLAQYWVGSKFPIDCTIPKETVNEVLRMPDHPTHCQIAKNSLTFHYKNGKWLRTQLFSSDWPNVDVILDQPFSYSELPTDFFEGLNKIEIFCEDNIVYFHEGEITTSMIPGFGSSYKLAGFEETGAYNIKMLKLLNGISNRFDFSSYPRPAGFVDANVRGVIIGCSQ